MSEIRRKTPPRFKTFPPGSSPHLIDPSTDEQRTNWSAEPVVKDRVADLVIAGGGLSGVAAAIAAARRDLSVVLIEQTHMVGGQATSGGVSAFDITFPFDHAINDHGIWSEIVQRTLDIYHDELGRPANVGHYRNGSLTPNVIVVERVLTEMLAAAGVTVIRNTRVTGVVREGQRVAGLITTAGAISATITVDATEDGSVLALGGVPHRVGTVVSDGSFVPEMNSNIQDITFTAVIREYPEGVPVDLQVTSPPPGYDLYADRLPRAFPPEGKVDTMRGYPGPLGFAGYRAAPDLSSDNMHTGFDWERVTRTSLNQFNDSPVNAKYLTDSNYREEREAFGILRTIGIIYYLQNELGLKWSVATDEGFDAFPGDRHNRFVPDHYRTLERHFPLIPYIRESRRLVGSTTLTGKMIYRDRMLQTAPWRPDSIATGTYHTDLHGSKRPQDLEADLNETIADKPVRETFGPFPIPMGTLVPEKIDGFLAAEKNISASRLAAGAIRVHPTVTAIGEAVGVLASIAVRSGVEPRQVPVAAVQYELARGGALVTPVSVPQVPTTDPLFPKVQLAATRMKVPMELHVPRDGEQYLTLDTYAAAEAASLSIDYLRRKGFLIDSDET